MSRWLALMCAAALVGCQAAPPVIDPFQSQQRVPPPGTGDITPIQPGMVGVPSGQPAPPAVTTPGNGYVPPAGSFNYGNGTGSIYANPSAGSPNNGAAPYGASGYGQPNYGAPATPQPTYGAPRPTTPVYPTPPGGVNPYPAQPGGGSIYNNRQSSFDRSVGAPAPRSAASGTMTVARIGANRDLDPRDATVPKAMQNKPEIDVGQIVQAGYEAADVDRRQPTRDEMPAAGEPSRRSEAPVARTRRSTRGIGPADRGETYGFDPNYAWLHGKLEYSQVQGQWKLRYIPLDGTTDPYGGSVVLAEDSPLAGHQPGEFVSVTGAIAKQAGSQDGFAPTYRAERIERLSNP